MSSQLFKLNNNDLPDTTNMRFGIVVSEWNSSITNILVEGAVNALKESGVNENNITICHVPGSFELAFGCAQLAQHGYVDAIIAIGCIIRGDTPHFDYICQGVTQGIAHLNTACSKPIIYGLITVNSLEQAKERAGGKLGNKGTEFAVTAIKMVDYAWQLQK